MTWLTCRRAVWLAVMLLMLALPGLTYIIEQHGNQLWIDGVPATLTFARGCTDPAQVPAYAAVGFNTLLVRVDSPGTVVMENAAALVAAAEHAGLYILIELANGSWSAGQQASLHDGEYRENAEYFLDGVVPHLRESPNLVGWVVSTAEENRLVTATGTLPQFLEAKYGTITALTTAWSYQLTEKRAKSVKISNFRVLSEEFAPRLAAGDKKLLKLIQDDIAEYRKSLDACDADFQQYLKAHYRDIAEVNRRWVFQFNSWEDIHIETIVKRQREKPLSSPLSLLELARYRAETQRSVLDWWITYLRERDKQHLIFAGGLSSYRAYSVVPSSCNGVLTESYPGLAEVDAENHNPHAIDIARHGNRFIVLAGIAAENSDPSHLSGHLYTAALHGAAGIGVKSWPAIMRDDGMRAAVRATLTDMAKRRLLGRTPAATVAVVYSPYAPGAGTGRTTLYGYMPAFLYDGPALLLFMLRQGTSYGQIDFLAPDDLTRVPLARYRTILLPAVLDFPEAAQLALLDYVQKGGTAVADMGAGMLQMDGSLTALSPPLTTLFRLQNFDPRPVETRLNMEVYRSPVPEFPALVSGSRTTGWNAGYTITHIARYVPLEGADLLFTTAANQKLKPPVPRSYKPLPRTPARGVFIARWGEGCAIFASFPLYWYWMPGCMLFEDFHRDLFSHGARVEMQRPIDFLPAQAAVAAYADGSVAVWGKDREMRIRLAQNPKRQAYGLEHGWCDVGPQDTILRTFGPGYHAAEPLPVFLEPVPFTIHVAVTQMNAKGIVLDFDVNDANAGTPVKVQLETGAYAITPASQHQVTLLTGAGGAVQTLRADGQGVLHLALPSARCQMTITGKVEIIESTPVPHDADPREVTIEAVPAPGVSSNVP